MDIIIRRRRRRIKKGAVRMSMFAESPSAIAISETTMEHYELHKMYDGTDSCGIFAVDADGDLEDMGIRFEGKRQAIMSLFAVWASENVPDGRVIAYRKPRY